ncbi:pentapeptide repeat-containing protein [Hymenobacter sp. YC55]|uniref:pentapeptide repeat-containing protein n=1 Tax=Hymenobacter sp. YC55 TaxID=3034019 RepID=UPI0023F6C399|nr:pentapeptide repeat-containing protein [Hymenobacter sp. YC55]MDF7815263.1 pentapeptide repeat-containing protein [Hymenobacter sp. YC55]
MAKIDRFRSPEEAERLAELKRGVDLGALATERYGYTLSDRTRDGGFTLRNEASGGGDRITVKMAPEGYHMYHNHNDNRDSGSVVDFLQHRHPDSNLGQVKGMLQEMVPGAKAALDYEKYAAQQVQKAPGAADARYESLPASERRAAMVNETTGNRGGVGQPPLVLTDNSYLLERGLTKDTVSDPAFKNRIFTDQHPERQERLGTPQHNVGFPFYNEKGIQSYELRNRAPEGETDSFKMMMKAPGDAFGAKNGVWSSDLTAGRGVPTERMNIGESPIDMMSKFQKEKEAATASGQELPNSRYVATGGTPSIEQKAIIQAIIDREQPKQVILTNDNDAAGQAFNIRYLNDLRPPLTGLSPEQQQDAAQARERTTWIAGDNGKKGEDKLLTMTITLRNDVPPLPGSGLNGPDGGTVERDTAGSIREGRKFVEELRNKAEARGLPSEEPEVTNGIGLNMRRNAPGQTEVVIRVNPAQAPELIDLARELRRDREQYMPEAARTPENYFVVEKANGKDYNQDILQGRADAQLEAARREAGFTVAPEVAPVIAPVAAAIVPEVALERAQLRVSDAEPLPAGVQPPDDRFRSLAQEVRSALEESGLQVATSPVPGATGTLAKTYLEFEYVPNSPQGLSAQQIVADVQANAPGRVDAAGIEPAAEGRAQSRFHLGLTLDYAPVALQTSPEASPVLEARLQAADLNVLPTQVNNEPGFVVVLDRSNALQAAALEHVVQLHEKENVAPLTVLQSEATVTDRQQGVAAYYDPERGANTQPPALTAFVLANQPEAGVEERLTKAGASVEQLFQSEAAKEVNAPLQVRIGFPLDQPEVVANVSRILEQVELTGETRWDREAREQLTLRQPERTVEAAAVPTPEIIDVLERFNPDPDKNYAKLGYPGSATAAVGYPGTEEAFTQRLVEAGATLIERPVTELAPAGTQSIAYPLDQPEVVARVSGVLDEIDSAAKARTANVGAEAGPVGVFEDSAYRETRQQAAEQYAPEQRIATPVIAADIDLSGSTSAAEIIRADRNRDGLVSGTELDTARFENSQTKEQQAAAPGAIAADINLNGSTSQAEILRADSNRDGVVTGTELDTARFEIAQAKERATAEQAQQTEAERQAEVRRRYEEQRQESEAQQQQAQGRDTSGPLRSAGVIIFDAEPLPAGTLAAGSATLISLAEKVQRAIEETGSEVNARPYRDNTTGQPATFISFNYHEGTAEQSKIQEVLRDATSQGGTKLFGIEPGVETQRETAPITRTVALNEQPLAIALDTPNPLLESQLRATGASVSNEPVQDRPGLVVVVDTQKGEQLAGVEQTLTKLPAAAVVVEGPEATEMRQQLTQTFRQQGGVAPALQAEAILPERIQNDVPERLREAGATVTAAPYATRPELGEGSISVRYPLDQPEVISRVSVVLDGVNSRSAQVATDLGQAPDVATGSVVETPLAQQTRQLVAKEQGVEPTGPRELPERQPTEDRTIDRPKSTAIIDTASLLNNDSNTVGANAANSPATRQISAEPEPHAVERRIILDMTNEKPGLAPTLEAALTRGGFQVAMAPIEAAGEEKGGTRIEALYRTTDTLASREQQAVVLRNIGKMDSEGLTLREPEGQAQERATALKGPGKPEANQMVAAGQTLRASITVLEVDGEKERTTRLWNDLRDAGAKVGHVAKTEMGAEGTKYAFPVEYRPSDTRLPVVSATLDAAARGEGIQVMETDNMRLERLARTSARESKDLAALSPEAREDYKRPAGKDYSAARPDAYERVALSSEELKSPTGVKTLRDELKETGAVVAVQQLDGRPAGSGTVTLSFVAESPKAEAVNEVLRSVSEKGGTVYDLKAGQDRGTEVGAAAVVAVEAAPRAPLSAEQEREANLVELRSLEARRDALRESQREATTQSQAAEQQLVPAVAVAAAVETVEVKPWVGFGPDLRGEDLRNTDATGMDLRGANLAGQDLRSTDLRDSDLREANLTGADLRGMNLTGVRLEDAVLDGANLEKAFRVVENSEGKRQMEDNLTPAILTGPEREGATFAPTVALNEQRLASAELAPAGEENSPAASPQLAMLQAPQYSGLNLPTEEEMRAQASPQGQPIVAQNAESEPAFYGGGNQPLPPMPSYRMLTDSELDQMAVVPAPVVELPGANQPGLNLPTQQELSFGPPPVEPVVEMPAVAPAGQEPGKGPATAEAVGLEVPAPVATPGTLSRYEELEEAGTTLHVASIHVTQPVWTEASGVALADMPDRVKEIQDRLMATGVEVELERNTTLDASGKNETSVLSLVYAHDDRNLPALHQAINEVANVPAAADYGVRVEDENAIARAATVESRMENTPEAAKALAAELHDGSQTTARLLIERPALEDVWALEDAGAKVARIYLPDGPAALVSYPAAEPGVTGPVSIELDRIERDSTLTRPPHNSYEREISGPLLGEDPAQQERRQEMAKAEGLVLEPQPRYELNEMAERDARAKSYFQEEIVRPSDPMSGQLANGMAFEGRLADVLQLEKPDRDALEASWKAERTTLVLTVQETPELRLEDSQPAAWPNRVAEALREAGAETVVKELGVSPDTGTEMHLIAVSFDNSDPALARIQATLNRLADQDGVQVPTEGYWQRETILGVNGSKMAEPEVVERDRPWLEAVVLVNEPTPQERRELTRAGARLEDAQMEGTEGKPAVLVYYDLDNPLTVAKVSPVLDRADEQGRLLGESGEARDARAGRVEQYQADIRLEKQQDGAAWEQLTQKYPQAAKPENELAEPTVALSFADRIRAAVNEQLADIKKGYEAASPENLAIYAAEQRGIADRQKSGQSEAEKAAYERGFNGPEATPAAAAAAAAGGIVAGTNGTSAELSSDKILRERRDDELTKPIVMDAPKEGKILETTEQLKPAAAGTPDQEKAAGEKIVPPAVVETPVVAAAVVTAQEAEKPKEKELQREKELQHGIIGMESSSRRTADERIELVRGALVTAGATVESVVPASRDNKEATLAYSYDPQGPKLAAVNEVLQNVEKAQPSMIREEPHSMHYAGIKPNTHEIPKQDWPEREGQFNKANIVVDDFDKRGVARAENIKGDLTKEGAVVGEVKKDGHGHVEMNVTYHTHTPNIDRINSTLDRAGNSPGIEVQETATDRSARYQGAIDQTQNKVQEKERERGE